MPALLAISFATVGPYADEELPRLIASCQRFDVALDYLILQPKQSWKHNCGMKPSFIRSMMDKYPDRPLLWIDADAEVTGDLSPLTDIKCDIAVRTRRSLAHVGPHVCSGTILVRPTDQANRLINRWCYRMEHDPIDWDQRILERTISESIANVADLDSRFCAIFDEGVEDARITHHQASRRLRRQAVDSRSRNRLRSRA